MHLLNVGIDVIIASFKNYDILSRVNKPTGNNAPGRPSSYNDVIKALGFFLRQIQTSLGADDSA